MGSTLLEMTYAPGVGPVRIETFAVVGGKASPQVRAWLLTDATRWGRVMREVGIGIAGFGTVGGGVPPSCAATRGTSRRASGRASW